MLDIPMASAAKRGSLTSAKSLHELKREAMDGPSGSQDVPGDSAVASIDETGTKPKGIRPSKSETSIVESFVVVEKRNNANYLRDGEIDFVVVNFKFLRSITRISILLTKMCLNLAGFMWQRQLVFRSKLTMHTAYDRKDNAEPASITALAVSKDHKSLYVGDARGRVFSWSVTEQPNRGMADHWLKDEGADQCVGCHVRYGENNSIYLL